MLDRTQQIAIKNKIDFEIEKQRKEVQQKINEKYNTEDAFNTAEMDIENISSEHGFDFYVRPTGKTFYYFDIRVIIPEKDKK